MSIINVTDERAALLRCGARAAEAADGRTIRGARVECRNALVRAGHRPCDAQRMAEAMARIGAGINRSAAAVAASLGRAS